MRWHGGEMTERREPYEVDWTAYHVVAETEDEARAAFVRKHGRQPRYVVEGTPSGWWAGPVEEVE